MKELFLIVFIILFVVLFISLLMRKKYSPIHSVHHSPLIIGHRGASGYCPENTMASYYKAIEMGVDFLEVDIHLSKDGVLVVHHDPTLDRTTDGKGNLRDYTAAELLKLDAGSWFHSRFKNERIPLLSEVLKTFLSDDIGILIEIKHPSLYPGIEKKLAEELVKCSVGSIGKNKVMIHSFDLNSMRTFHNLLPDIPVGLLIKRHISDQKLKEISEFASFVNPKQTMLNQNLKTRIQKQGMKVFTWTVNNKKQIKLFNQMELDGIISDFPDYFASRQK